MTDLSVIIAARNEEFLQNTIDDVLKNAQGDTEIIVILDGYWPNPGIPQHPKVTIVHHEESIGQRAAINEAAKLSEAKYIMKLDAHCNVSKGFDVALMENCEHDWTVVPRMYNLHAFDWRCKRCGYRSYQGPKPEKCEKCGSKYSKKVIVWKEKRNPQSDYMGFDSDLKFQYWREFKKRPEAKGDITDLMSFIGACWFMERSRYWEIDGLEESWGSWGQVGTEIACKSWLSGGRLCVNKKSHFGHMFRTGNGFGFPYKLSGRKVKKAREICQDTFRNNKWDKQVRPLSWMLEKFWPIPNWTDEDLKEQKKREVASETVERLNVRLTPNKDKKWNDEGGYIKEMRRYSHGKPIQKALDSIPTKGIVYYTDNQCQERIISAARKRLLAATNGHPIVSVSQYPIDFGKNIVVPYKRSVLSMFKQILDGLEAIDTDIVFLCEHDVLYHPTHFNFTPPRDDVYYYNNNVWAVDADTGQANYYEYRKQVSGLVAYRSLLLDHYRRRVAHVEKHGFTRKLGFEPGKKKPRGLDNYKYEYFRSDHPNVDIKHSNSVTKGRFKLEQYRCRNRIKDSWILADNVPAWGITKGRFDDFLREANV